MIKKATLIFVLIILFVGCKKVNKPVATDTDFLYKTQLGFDKMSDGYYMKIYLDYDCDKENPNKNALYQFAYTFRLKTDNLRKTLSEPEAFNTLKDSIYSFNQLVFSQIDSISDPLITGFIKNQIEYKNVQFDKVPAMDKIAINEILTDIKIVEYEVLNHLYNKQK